MKKNLPLSASNLTTHSLTTIQIEGLYHISPHLDSSFQQLNYNIVSSVHKFFSAEEGLPT
jgi:hypothetical protein